MFVGIAINLTGQLLSSATPVALFALAEPGVWYDPSDVANTKWRYNLLTFTEQFDNAAWFKDAATISVNAITAPDGTLTADKLVENTANTTHDMYALPATQPIATFTYSLYVKTSGRTKFRLQQNSTTAYAVLFDLVAMTVTPIAGGAVGIITNAGNGWYRCSTTYTTTVSFAPVLTLYLADAAGSISYTGDGTSGIYVWGAQLELSTSSTPQAYQRISDVNTEVVERFPKATLFQDNAGTTPVTAPGQTVGLMLDKSQGATPGSELVTNGDFSGGSTGWTLGTGWTISGGTATYSSATASQLQQANVFQVGKAYKVSFNITAVSAGYIVLAGLTVSAVGTYTTLYTATLATLGAYAGANSNITIDNISVKLLAGNHATQATSTQRPTYGINPITGTRNLLTYTEQLDNAAWAKSNITISANTTTDPNGASTADTLTANIGLSNHRVISSTATLAVGQSCVHSVYFKAGTYNLVQIHDGASASYFANFNLTSGTVASSTGCTATITPVGNGWYRCAISMTLNGANPILGISLISSGTAVRNETWTAAGTETVFAWGAQTEASATATAYQKVVSQYEVTEAGVQSASYLAFDGVDDGMVTNTITPGIDKVQVFAGVRKLSDATTGMVVEASTALSSNLGAFFLAAPNGATSNYSFVSKGSVPTFGAEGLANGFAAPTTNVVTGLGNISGNSAIIRVNETQRAVSTTVQGTGNYLAYPLYIGRRGGVSIPFNGRIYSLITRFGANLTTGQITSTESWVNAKTGAY